MTKENSTPPVDEQHVQTATEAAATTTNEAVDAATEAAAEPAAQDQVAQRVSELELALSQAEQRVEEANDRAIRAVAEMENVRRRAAQDVEKAHKFALEKFALELLSTVDNLRSEEHTSELQSRPHLVCRLLLEKKKHIKNTHNVYTNI